MQSKDPTSNQMNAIAHTQNNDSSQQSLLQLQLQQSQSQLRAIQQQQVHQFQPVMLNPLAMSTMNMNPMVPMMAMGMHNMNMPMIPNMVPYSIPNMLSINPYLVAQQQQNMVQQNMAQLTVPTTANNILSANAANTTTTKATAIPTISHNGIIAFCICQAAA